MSTTNIIARTAAAISEVEAAVEATRQAHTNVSTATIEGKMTAFAEVVTNTRRKMTRPAGFEWALHTGFKVVAISDTDLTVEATKGRSEPVTLTVPRADLSLSTWQVTSIIRRLSAERLLGDLQTEVTAKKRAVSVARKEAAAAQDRLVDSARALTEAQEAVDRKAARLRVVEAKRAAARARRKTPVPVAG